MKKSHEKIDIYESLYENQVHRKSHVSSHSSKESKESKGSYFYKKGYNKSGNNLSFLERM